MSLLKSRDVSEESIASIVRVGDCTEKETNKKQAWDEEHYLLRYNAVYFCRSSSCSLFVS
jgi:hypothetical protein